MPPILAQNRITIRRSQSRF